jgi:CTP synthase (UTP-ammonia lyase)
VGGTLLSDNVSVSNNPESHNLRTKHLTHNQQNQSLRSSTITPVSDAVRIGILGDFNPDFRSHPATTDSLQHAARKLKIEVVSEWIPTPSLATPEGQKRLESCDGLWASPGSPYKSFDGMLKGIEFARRRDWPFLGTCGGFQYTLIEFARNVLHIADADSAENSSGSKNIIIYPVACAVPNRKGAVPKLSGAIPEIRLRPGSYLQSFYGKDKETATEEFFCNFEVNPEYEWTTMEAGFPIVARGSQGEIRAIESPTHRFFLATLFQPQLSSTEKKPHPVILAFVQAANDWGKKKLDDSVLE